MLQFLDKKHIAGRARHRQRPKAQGHERCPTQASLLLIKAWQHNFTYENVRTAGSPRQSWAMLWWAGMPPPQELAFKNEVCGSNFLQDDLDGRSNGMLEQHNHAL